MKRKDDTPGDIQYAGNKRTDKTNEYVQTDSGIQWKDPGKTTYNIEDNYARLTESYPRSIHDLDTGENHVDEGSAFLTCCDEQVEHQCDSDRRFFYSTEGDSIDDVIEALGETFVTVHDMSSHTEPRTTDSGQLEASCRTAMDAVRHSKDASLYQVDGTPKYSAPTMDGEEVASHSSGSSNILVPGTPATWHYPEMCEILRSLNGLPYLTPDIISEASDSFAKESQNKRQLDRSNNRKIDMTSGKQTTPAIGWDKEKHEFSSCGKCDENDDEQTSPVVQQGWLKTEPAEQQICLKQEHAQRESGEQSPNKDSAFAFPGQYNNGYAQIVPGTHDFNCRLLQEQPLVDSLIQDWTLTDKHIHPYPAAPPVWYYPESSPDSGAHLEHRLTANEEDHSAVSCPSEPFWYYPDISPNSAAHFEQSSIVNESGNCDQGEGRCEGNVFRYPDVGYLEYVPGEEKGYKRSRGRRGLIGHKQQGKRGCRLWEFIRNLLLDPVSNPSLIRWEDREVGTFRLVQSKTIARIWGSKKGNGGMNYEKLSRAMRYYYKRQIFAPVYGKRLVYSFGPRATGWRASDKK